MEKIVKNSRVIISDDRALWNNKTGIVLSNNIDMSDQESEVKVKVQINDEKFVIQTFPLSALSLKDAISEDTQDTDTLKSSEDKNISIRNAEEFIEYFIGKNCKFKGFNYDELFSKVEDDEGNYVFRDSDLEYINYYEYLKSLNGKIIRCAIYDSYNPQRSLLKNFNSAFWDIKFDNGDTLTAIIGEDIVLSKNTFDNINESRNTKVIKDIIKPYIISSDFDEEKESWLFASKIATAENIPESEILKIAANLKYRIFKVHVQNKTINIIASSKIDANDIEEDYAGYLPGFISIERVN